MAKSLRSKWKRKMRATKRVKYEKRELDRLVSILPKDEVEVKEEEMKEDKPEVSAISSSPSGEEMDEDGKQIERKYSRKSLKDQFGNYPPWMNKRRIDAQKTKNRKRLQRGRSKSAMKQK